VGHRPRPEHDDWPTLAEGGGYLGAHVKGG